MGPHRTRGKGEWRRRVIRERRARGREEGDEGDRVRPGKPFRSRTAGGFGLLMLICCLTAARARCVVNPA